VARTLLLIQQSARRHGTPPILDIADPWLWWTPEDIATATNCPVDNVTDDWPAIYTSLIFYGLADYDTCRAVLATIAIETAHTFKPVQESFWLDDAWRWQNLRYAPYWGRGYVQMTWLENYQYYGWRIGHPEIVTFPDKAMVPFIAAQLLAAYFSEKGIQHAAQQQNWPECRRLVQGGYAGLPEFVGVVNDLQSRRLLAA
jgi:hypothetical protein